MKVTERVKLWSKFNPVVDQEDVKAQFIRRIHSDRLKRRRSLRRKPSDRAQIPEMIQHYYKNPQDLLPSLKNIRRWETVENRISTHRNWWNGEQDPVVEEVDDSENLKSIDEDLKLINGANATFKRIVENGDSEVTVNGAKMDVEEEIHSTTERISPTLQSHLETDEDDDSLADLVKDYFDRTTTKVEMQKRLSKIFKDYSRRGQLDDFLREIRETNENNTGDIKLFTEQRTGGGGTFQTSDDRIKIISEEVQSNAIQEKIRSRAVLTPFDPDGGLDVTQIQLKLSVQMRYRKLTVGTQASSDLVLGKFSRCSQQSDKHAIIFYDDATRTFELLNYSEHGTEVNGQMFANNCLPREPAPKEEVGVLEIVTEIIDRKRGIKRVKYGDLDYGRV